MINYFLKKIPPIRYTDNLYGDKKSDKNAIFDDSIDKIDEQALKFKEKVNNL